MDRCKCGGWGTALSKMAGMVTDCAGREVDWTGLEAQERLAVGSVVC